MAGSEVITWPISESVDDLPPPLPVDQLYLPAKFPDIDTDLKRPPTNWLRSHTKVEKYAKNFKWHKENSRKSSFSMAHKVPELVGEDVDVISDSENIKQLLKMPFAKSHVSLMVHRVGKTLLIDDFDIHKHLLRDQREEWKWMLEFYKETVLDNMHQKMKCVPRKNRSRDHLQMRNMLSKFLYYSIAETKDSSMPDSWLRRCAVSEENASSLPDPLPELDASHKLDSGALAPDPFSEVVRDECAREVLWEFKDIRMLIGTDLPIFRAGSHPCVSVRLREMRQPINVLTGLDCWLDNLMCNVPNLAMCYHINGLIKDYKLIKTEDIPKEDGGQFSPQVVTDIARNILSFLKSNATKEGHTYWLYKETDDEVVKLYDLTTLCADHMADRADNQFTVPLGMLLYRVARNMREGGSDSLGTICTLLKTCLLLLDPHIHAQVYTSATYLLADLYVPDSVLHDPTLFVAENDLNESNQGNDDGMHIRSVPLSELCLPQKDPPLPLVTHHRLTGTLQSRCQESLKHAQKGVECLDRDVTYQLERSSSTAATSPSSTAIPLHFDAPPTPHESLSELRLLPPDTWHGLSKFLLLRKATIAYFKLASRKVEAGKYGVALRNVRQALMCYAAMTSVCLTKASESPHLLSDILGLTGDVRMFMARNTRHASVYREQFMACTPYDTALRQSAEKEVSQQFEYDWWTQVTTSLSQNLLAGAQSYEGAINVEQRPHAVASLTKRLGNAHNELGVFYMNEILEMLVDHDDDARRSSDAVGRTWKKSCGYFDAALRAFKAAQDDVNQALVLSNMGRLMRICAQVHVETTTNSTREFTQQERSFYTQAVECYENALLRLPKSMTAAQTAGLRVSVDWELSTTFFNLGALMQDNPPLSWLGQDEVEKRVIESLTRAQEHCVMSDAGSDDDLTRRRLRLAHINYKLATLHHHAYRNQHDPVRRRYMKQLALGQYDKCVALYRQTTAHTECLRAQLEMAALHEFCYSDQSGHSNRVKSLEEALVHLVSCEATLGNLIQATPTSCNEETHRLLEILHSRLAFICLHLTKMYAAKKKSSESRSLAMAKSMYCRVLKVEIQPEMSVAARCDLLKRTLCHIRQIRTENHDAGSKMST